MTNRPAVFPSPKMKILPINECDVCFFVFHSNHHIKKLGLFLCFQKL